jgi:hypothetical protein
VKEEERIGGVELAEVKKCEECSTSVDGKYGQLPPMDEQVTTFAPPRFQWRGVGVSTLSSHLIGQALEHPPQPLPPLAMDKDELYLLPLVGME